ncbi:hypothetical protein ZIOFF_016869 [Zingiber officinale]|uniref:CST complex subunit STN1 n=1 Tax=Zingiber officinale TaxID=94328 RepID=A0A8J5HEX9_ZINOF|nr:hypothetical protein ZIOFF_016869 [Zingiber officinale]
MLGQGVRFARPREVDRNEAKTEGVVRVGRGDTVEASHVAFEWRMKIWDENYAPGPFQRAKSCFLGLKFCASPMCLRPWDTSRCPECVFPVSAVGTPLSSISPNAALVALPPLYASPQTVPRSKSRVKAALRRAACSRALDVTCHLYVAERSRRVACLSRHVMCPRLTGRVVNSRACAVGSPFVACLVTPRGVSLRASPRCVTSSAAGRTDETLTLHLYDGNDTITCIQFLHRHPESVVPREIVIRQAEIVDAGKAVRVRGKIRLSPDGELQLIGCSVMVKEDPNVETLHILKCPECVFLRFGRRDASVHDFTQRGSRSPPSPLRDASRRVPCSRALDVTCHLYVAERSRRVACLFRHVMCPWLTGRAVPSRACAVASPFGACPVMSRGVSLCASPCCVTSSAAGCPVASPAVSRHVVSGAVSRRVVLQALSSCPVMYRLVTSRLVGPRGMQVWRVETVGVVVSKERTDDYLRFVVDDGTGCIPCILNLTNRSDLGLVAEVETEIALREAATVELGKLVRV